MQVDLGRYWNRRLVSGQLLRLRGTRADRKCRGLEMASPRLSLWNRFYRLLRPRMLRISCAQLFAYLRIRVGPETRQIVGHLLRPVVGSEQVQQHADAAGGDAG